MIHIQQVEDSHLRKRNRESKKAKSFEGSSSKSRLDVQDKLKFKKMFSNQVPSNFSKNRNDRGSNPKPQEGRNVDPPKE